MRSGARLARVLFGAFFALIYVVVFAFGYAERGRWETCTRGTTLADEIPPQ
jgi:hypothetical protein